jgi:hypothetical protein
MPKVMNRNRNCANCQKEFSLDDEGARKKYCSERCMSQFHWNKQGKKYRNSEKGKASMFAWRLRKEFGITVDDYNNMLEAQNHSCAICKRTDPTGYGWHVDHCHAKGHVRGLLCSLCNQGLGLFKENSDVMKRAIEYIETR